MHIIFDLTLAFQIQQCGKLKEMIYFNIYIANKSGFNVSTQGERYFYTNERYLILRFTDFKGFFLSVIGSSLKVIMVI